MGYCIGSVLIKAHVIFRWTTAVDLRAHVTIALARRLTLWKKLSELFGHVAEEVSIS